MAAAGDLFAFNNKRVVKLFRSVLTGRPSNTGTVYDENNVIKELNDILILVRQTRVAINWLFVHCYYDVSCQNSAKIDFC